VHDWLLAPAARPGLGLGGPDSRYGLSVSAQPGFGGRERFHQVRPGQLLTRYGRHRRAARHGGAPFGRTLHDEDQWAARKLRLQTQHRSACIGQRVHINDADPPGRYNGGGNFRGVIDAVGTEALAEQGAELDQQRIIAADDDCIDTLQP
jgi:hypothetical protein